MYQTTKQQMNKEITKANFMPGQTEIVKTNIEGKRTIHILLSDNRIFKVTAPNNKSKNNTQNIRNCLLTASIDNKPIKKSDIKKLLMKDYLKIQNTVINLTNNKE